jgi:hypothetical protein
MADFKPFTNSHIFGNPIKTKDIFQGRQNVSDFLKCRLLAGNQSFIIVLCEEQRIGKIFVLFQILNRELGAEHSSHFTGYADHCQLEEQQRVFRKSRQGIGQMFE